MGVKLLGKIKIHEIAKKVGLTSKEVIEKAKELGIAVTSHLSTVEDEQAVRLEQALSNDKINICSLLTFSLLFIFRHSPSLYFL